MPERSSQFTPPSTPLREDRRRVEREIIWDRPVFRPPVLPGPQVRADALPVKELAFGHSRPTIGR